MSEYEGVVFEGNPLHKEQAIESVDKALKEQGDFKAYGNLSGGLEKLKEEKLVTRILMRDGYYEVSVYPDNPIGGHDFSFRVDMKTGKISNVCVGEIVPPPDI